MVLEREEVIHPLIVVSSFLHRDRSFHLSCDDFVCCVAVAPFRKPYVWNPTVVKDVGNCGLSLTMLSHKYITAGRLHINIFIIKAVQSIHLLIMARTFRLTLWTTHPLDAPWKGEFLIKPELWQSATYQRRRYAVVLNDPIPRLPIFVYHAITH